MELFYYTIDDLRLPPKRRHCRGWTMKRFQTPEAALDYFCTLPNSGVKVLGLTDGAHVLELVKCLPLFPESEEGECVLASDHRTLPRWAEEPEAAIATEACVSGLKLRYAVDGNVIVPIPSSKGLPKDLQDKYLWLNISGEERSAIRWVNVAGRGWVPSGALDRQTPNPPLVLKYRVDGIDAQGAYLALEVEPWQYHLLLQRTLERKNEQKRKNT